MNPSFILEEAVFSNLENLKIHFFSHYYDYGDVIGQHLIYRIISDISKYHTYPDIYTDTLISVTSILFYISSSCRVVKCEYIDLFKVFPFPYSLKFSILPREFN